jgi:hypothetical protein
MCTVTDLVLASSGMDAGASYEGTFGTVPHPVAMSQWGFAAGFAKGTSPPTELDVAFFDNFGKPIATDIVSVASTLFPAGTGIALAPIGCGEVAAAWTDYGGDGDGAGVALRALGPGSPVVGAPGHANVETSFNQVLQDMIWTGSELVVAWADDSDASSLGALKVRTFDATLTPTSQDQTLAKTAGLSTSAVLAPFATSWAAAWLSYDNGGVSVLASAGSTSWTAGTLTPDATVDRPALVDLDATHLFLVYATSAAASDPAQLYGAVLDSAMPGTVVPFTIPASAVPAGAELREPALARVGSRVFLTWLSNTALTSPDSLPGDLWIKEIDLGSMPGMIDMSQAEIPLPRESADSTGAQSSPVLALSVGGGPELVVAAWLDQSVSGPFSRVFAEAIPVPLLRKAGQ